MLKNYITTALRVMLRQKAYSAINIAGLSIGIAATLIIIVYVIDELSYDKFHQHAGQIYRVGFKGRLQGNEFVLAVSAPPVADAIQKEIPEAEEVVRFGLWRTMPMSYGENTFTEKHMLIADSNFFRFFSFKVIEGDVNSFLKGPNKLVITQSAATRYFGKENPIGKIMLRGSEKIATQVVGVVEDAPSHSHIPFDMILSGESWSYMQDTQWTSNNLYSYVRFRSDSDMNKVRRQLNEMAEKNIGAELERVIGVSLKQLREKGDDVGIFLQPMLDIHLESSLDEELLPGGSMQYLYIFSAIALFIILIACINFMNLSTARSANRAKEVGIRKTVGAVRNRLVFQFLSESMVYSILSMVIALGIIGMCLTSFNYLAGKQLTMSMFSQPLVVGGLFIFTLFVGLVSGSYPAFFLTAFKPTEVLKGKVRAGFRNSALRNSLVVLQFVISIALIFGSVVVYRQLKFMQEKNLGFEKENVVTLLHTIGLGKNGEAFKNELAANPAFKSASYANTLPPNVSWNSAFRKHGSDADFLLFVYQVDYDHLSTMGYEVAEGRFFSREFRNDTAAVLLNETAYRQMGFASIEEANILSYQGEQPQVIKVIGVLKDFNFRSVKDEVKPMIIFLGREPNFEMAIRLTPGNTQEKLATLESIYKKYAPGSPFEYSFLDQNFDALFRAEERMSRIILIFTILAIGIACLGLFGLAAFTAEQRAKEISIRKVMGASVSQMTVLMSKDFALLVLVAFVIATPLAWYMTNGWLEGFAARISIDVTIALLSGVLAMTIALLTISVQSIKAARENPVKAMRSE